ncbi:MAG TPA: hypothetical protein VFV92_14010 [Candidatus Bathyarchaeia archaeon]|nr:hypothetical protein [Candidatus Bathyarchaeia archaeon]
MISIGTNIRRTETGEVGIVTRMTTEYFYVYFGGKISAEPVPVVYGDLFDVDGHGAPYTVEPVHAVTSPPARLFPPDVRDFYIKLIASMEYRLFDVYQTASRASEMNDGDHTASVQWNLDYIKDRIESTADQLASMTRPTEGISGEYLRDAIYKTHK